MCVGMCISAIVWVRVCICVSLHVLNVKVYLINKLLLLLFVPLCLRIWRISTYFIRSVARLTICQSWIIIIFISEVNRVKWKWMSFSMNLVYTLAAHAFKWIALFLRRSNFNNKQFRSGDSVIINFCFSNESTASESVAICTCAGACVYDSNTITLT